MFQLLFLISTCDWNALLMKTQWKTSCTRVRPVWDRLHIPTFSSSGKGLGVGWKTQLSAIGILSGAIAQQIVKYLVDMALEDATFLRFQLMKCFVWISELASGVVPFGDETMLVLQRTSFLTTNANLKCICRMPYWMWTSSALILRERTLYTKKYVFCVQHKAHIWTAANVWTSHNAI